jgi:hypothetical protein
MLDVLPLDGRLHVRVDAKAEPKPEEAAAPEAVAAWGRGGPRRASRGPPRLFRQPQPETTQ